MPLTFQGRKSDSPWIDTVWSCTSANVTRMTSVATPRWGLIFFEQDGRPFAGVTGPESGSRDAWVPEDATFVGIEFAIGTTLVDPPTSTLVDGGATLDRDTTRSFRLAGARWEVPGMDDAEALVARLVGNDVIARDPIVTDVLRGADPAVSTRTIERRFRATAGFTQGVIRQIDRARNAALLLSRGDRVADVITDLGYYDEPHLGRSLRRFVGRTVCELRDGTDRPLGLGLQASPSADGST